MRSSPLSAVISKANIVGGIFSLLLCELAQHEVRSFCLVIDQIATMSKLPFWKDVSNGLTSGELTVQREQYFPGLKKRRSADLAIVRGEELVVLVEVKEFDHLNPENPAQLADYIRQLSRGLGFIHLHRFLPSSEHKQKDGWPVAMLSYDQIYNALRNLKDEGRALGALICHYLEDIGVGIYREIGKSDSKALSFLLVQMLGFPNQTNMGRLHSQAAVQRGPQILTALLADAEVIGEWVRRGNDRIIKRRCSTRFEIEPLIDHKSLRKALINSGDQPDELPNGISKYVKGGGVYFYADVSLHGNRLPKGDYLRLRLGFGLTVDTDVKFFVYTTFYGRYLKWWDTYEESACFKILPKEEAKAHMFFKSCLTASKRKALKLTSGPSNTLLNRFVIPN
jgi:hypothetical protein